MNLAWDNVRVMSLMLRVMGVEWSVLYLCIILSGFICHQEPANQRPVYWHLTNQRPVLCYPWLSSPPGNWDLVTRERGKMDGDTVDTGRVTRLLGSHDANFSFFCFDTDTSLHEFILKGKSLLALTVQEPKNRIWTQPKVYSIWYSGVHSTTPHT